LTGLNASAEGASQRRQVRNLESRFQRSLVSGNQFLGRCPRLKNEIAPLALHTNVSIGVTPEFSSLRRVGYW
jgi:hypothetical protein